MTKRKYQCKICGQWYRSKNTPLNHAKYGCKTPKRHVSKPVSIDKVNDHPIDKVNDHPIDHNSGSKLRIFKIDLRQEYEKMTEKINKRKEEEREAKYECGECGYKFYDDERPKACPKCGVVY